MGGFSARLDKALRLTVLHVLAAAAAEGVGEVNDAVLRSSVCDFGPRPSAQSVEAAVEWLAAEKLLTVRPTGGRFRVVGLTDLGADVAAGRVLVPGVRRAPLEIDG